MTTLADWVEFNPKVKLEKDKIYPFVGMDVISPGSRYVQANEKRKFTGGGAKFKSGDTLFARITPCLENGKIAQFVGDDFREGAFGSTEFFVLRAIPGKSIPSFVYYLSQTNLLRDTAIKSMVGASGRQRADINVLRELEIEPPSLKEQLQISEVLSAYDDLITANQRRITLLEDAARRLYREWFVHLRFPGHEQVAVKDGVPQGWEKQMLSAVANVNARSISAREKPDSVLYIDISSVSTGIINEVTAYAFVDAPGRARRRITHGDIIWSCVRPNRRSYALIWEPDENLVASTGFAVLSAVHVPFSYLYFTTTTDNFIGHLEKNATGAAYPAVTAKIFENAEITIPDNGTLFAFDSLVLPQLEQIETLKQQNRQLAQARDLLLPKLMSGQLDVTGIALPEEVTA